MRDSWLKPNGEIIEVGNFMHNEYASNLLEEEMGLLKMMDYLKEKHLSYPYEVLHERGWVRIKFNKSYAPKIKILGGCIDMTKPMRNTIDPAMNQTQLKVAKRLCEESNETLHRALNDKRFW